MIYFQALCIATLATGAIGAQNNPVCEVCGCPTCPLGSTVGDGTTTPVPPEFADQAPPGFTEIPCSLLEFAGTSGQLSAEVCSSIQNSADIRMDCGCPSLPSCEVCGCPNCPPGSTVGDGTTTPVPPEFADQAPPGFTEIPCSLLEFAGTSGQLSAEVCSSIQNSADIRMDCGCPPLPSPSANPSSAPSTTPSASPSESPSTTPSASPSESPSSEPSLSSMPSSTPSGSPSQSPVEQAPVEEDECFLGIPVVGDIACFTFDVIEMFCGMLF